MDWGFVGVAIAAAATMGGFVGWLISERRYRRENMPALTWNGRQFIIHNHLREFVTISEIRAPAKLALDSEPDEYGGGSDRWHYLPSPLEVSWSVAPGSKAWFELRSAVPIDHVRVVIESSSRTIRRRRVTVAHRA